MNLYTFSDWRFDRSMADGSEADFAGGNGGSEGSDCCWAWAVKPKLKQKMATKQARFKPLANGDGWNNTYPVQKNSNVHKAPGT